MAHRRDGAPAPSPAQPDGTSGPAAAASTRTPAAMSRGLTPPWPARLPTCRAVGGRRVRARRAGQADVVRRTPGPPEPAAVGWRRAEPGCHRRSTSSHTQNCHGELVPGLQWSFGVEPGTGTTATSVLMARPGVSPLHSGSAPRADPVREGGNATPTEVAESAEANRSHARPARLTWSIPRLPVRPRPVRRSPPQ